MIDALFINPGNAQQIYQDLAKDYAAIEPPTWALLLANSCRSVGYSVGLIDVNAEQLLFHEVLERIKSLKPRLICFVIYGQNVNAGTVGMSGAVALANFLKEEHTNYPIAFLGSHVQALPIKTLKEEHAIDFLFTNEGVYALRNILALKIINPQTISTIKGICYRSGENVIMTPPEALVPNDRMDIDLPGYAWDLLPQKNSPLDLYRSPLWHAEYDHNKRSPYAAIQTSIGCQFACDFCMINIINRNDNTEIGVAGNYSKMRYWSPEFIIKEFDKLYEMGARTIRIVDEMFLLNKKFYLPLCDLLIERGYGEHLRMWAYSRIDTITNPEILNKVRRAGIKWLCLGIESGDRNIRLEVSKGNFKDVDIHKVVKQVEDADINVLANYIFGLPNDTFESMQKTLDLSLELCTVGWNAYSALPLPGTKLYSDALKSNQDLPTDYIDWSFHSYTTKPIATTSLTSKQILQFRDEAFERYHQDKKFLEKINSKFGLAAQKNIEVMTKIKLKRKILEE